VVTTRMVPLCVSARESSPLAVNEPIAESVPGRLTEPPHRNRNRLGVPTGNPDDPQRMTVHVRALHIGESIRQRSGSIASSEMPVKDMPHSDIPSSSRTHLTSPLA